MNQRGLVATRNGGINLNKISLFSLFYQITEALPQTQSMIVVYLSFSAADADGVYLTGRPPVWRDEQVKGLSRSNTQFVISNHEKGVNVLLSLSSYFLAHGY